MALEDPSIVIKENEETGQLLISALGELHLEILIDRVKKEHGITPELGPMRVAYRESISDETEVTFKVEKMAG